jgi:hypothetical protein
VLEDRVQAVARLRARRKTESSLRDGVDVDLVDARRAVMAVVVVASATASVALVGCAARATSSS